MFNETIAACEDLLLCYSVGVASEDCMTGGRAYATSQYRDYDLAYGAYCRVRCHAEAAILVGWRRSDLAGETMPATLAVWRS